MKHKQEPQPTLVTHFTSRTPAKSVIGRGDPCTASCSADTCKETGEQDAAAIPQHTSSGDASKRATRTCCVLSLIPNASRLPLICGTPRYNDRQLQHQVTYATRCTNVVHKLRVQGPGGGACPMQRRQCTLCCDVHRKHVNDLAVQGVQMYQKPQQAYPACIHNGCFWLQLARHH